MAVIRCPFCYHDWEEKQLPVVARNFQQATTVSATSAPAPRTHQPPTTLTNTADGHGEGNVLGGLDDALGGFNDDSFPNADDYYAVDDEGTEREPPRPTMARATRNKPVSGAKTVGQLGPYPVLHDPEVDRSQAGFSVFGGAQRFDRRDLPARACRNCEMPLPDNLADVDVITIGVVGNQAAGKSHYLTAVLHEMVNRQRLHALGIGTVDTVGDTADRFHERWRRVYRERLAHRRTTTMEGMEAMRKPLALQLDTVTGRHAMLMFHDVPGEWLVDENERARHFGYLDHLDGLIFIIDPLPIPAVRERLEPTIDERHFYDMVVPQQNLMTALGRQLGHRASEIPVSIVISKGDMIEAAFEPMEELRSEEARNSDDLVEQVKTLHKVTKGRVFAWLNEPALEIAAQRFPTAVYHTVSALGTLPDADTGAIAGHVRPSRVIDPIFRILREL